MPEIENKNLSNQPECCCGPKDHEIKEFRRVETSGKTIAGNVEVDVVTSVWSLKDWAGAFMVRLGLFRMDYAVKPGLYAVGKPDKDSPVFVSANYKLSFDILRKDLAGVNGWILVLDTKGVNVWCAAGKRTFGTKEIVSRIALTGLADVVSHRDIIVPQLGAPGVSAFKVMLFSGFKVIFGPVRSGDIKNFLAAGMKADEEMRRVRFNLADRLVVSVLEIMMVLESALPAGLALIAVYALFAGRFSIHTGLQKALLPLIAFFTAAVSGTIFTAALLPYIPGRAFSIKGAFMGLATGAAALFIVNGSPALTAKNLSFIIFVTSASAYLALNFTGSSTFTSLSGVKREVRLSVPLIIGFLLVSIITFVVNPVRDNGHSANKYIGLRPPSNSMDSNRLPKPAAFSNGVKG